MEPLHQYFRAEVQGGLLAIVLGLASVGLGSYVWSVRSPFRAMVWPLAIIGVAEIGLGAGLVMRTPPQVRTLEAGFSSAQQPTAAAELERMTRVNRTFRIVEIVEALVIALGVSLALYVRATNPMWAGVGMGLFLQAAVLLVFDLFAEQRALTYTRWLSGVVVTGLGASGQGVGQ